MPARSERAPLLREHAPFLVSSCSPLRTASVVLSSTSLAEQVITPAAADPFVVELGPGTGVVTEAIQHRLAGRGRHLAVELNETMAAHVSRRCPGVELVTGAAADLPDFLAARGIAGADHVVSGLPWPAFAGPAGRALVVLVGLGNLAGAALDAVEPAVGLVGPPLLLAMLAARYGLSWVRRRAKTSLRPMRPVRADEAGPHGRTTCGTRESRSG